MSFLVRGVRNFWFGTPKRPVLNRHPAPWPAPRRPAFRPTPPPKPTTLVGKVKSYIPGRNWLIFGGVVLGWVGLSAYDKWKADLIVKAACQKVAHKAGRPIGEYENVPGLSVFICAPPGDQLKWNKDVWRKFVKPIIVAAGYDYSLELHTKQGAGRTSMRKQILESRKQQTLPADERTNTRQAEGGDVIVIGRNTFKETIRGIQEGYLLPLDYTPPQEPQQDSTENAGEPQPLPPPENTLLPAIPESEFASLLDPEDGPEWIFTYVPSTHILGIRHTPRRIFRFLTRRYQAEEICATIVAVLLQQSEREWREDDTQLGAGEERFWPKTVTRDAEWREDLVVDPRIRPRFRWRMYQPVETVPEWRESSEPTYVSKVEELVPTEEERVRDERIREEAEQAKRVAMQRRSSFYPGLNLFGTNEPRSQ